jgi:hypothetical protein
MSFSTSIASSTRLPRASYGAPHQLNSFGDHPTPSHDPNRPPVSATTDPTCLASSTGLREPSLSTDV